MSSDGFAAITCFFNPANYLNRTSSYFRFAEELQKQNVDLWTIEAAFADEEFIVPKTEKVIRVILPQKGFLWQKERLLNLLIESLPSHITKVAWLDCDILFQREDWAELACEALESSPVIQLFKQVQLLGPDEEPILWASGKKLKPSLAFKCKDHKDVNQSKVWASGFAWAAQRSLLKEIGLYENVIVGGADLCMALGFYNTLDHPYLSHFSKELHAHALEYANKAHSLVNGNVSFIPGRIKHLWHGDRLDRKYGRGAKTLKQLGFDPKRDLEINSESGLLQWSSLASLELQEYVKEYFLSRKEDDSEVALRNL